MTLGAAAVDLGLVLVAAFVSLVVAVVGALIRRAIRGIDDSITALLDELRELAGRVRVVELEQAEHRGFTVTARRARG